MVSGHVLVSLPMAEVRHTFDALIEAGTGGGALIEVPLDIEAVFGTRGRVKVRATFDGHPYRGSIAPMGGRYVLGLVKAIREAIGKGPGDHVAVTLEPDHEERLVEVPPELADALGRHPEAARFFEGLAYTYRKEYARWIAGAKRPETRARRLEKAIETLARGEKL